MSIRGYGAALGCTWTVSWYHVMDQDVLAEPGYKYVSSDGSFRISSTPQGHCLDIFYIHFYFNPLTCTRHERQIARQRRSKRPDR